MRTHTCTHTNTHTYPHTHTHTHKHFLAHPTTCAPIPCLHFISTTAARRDLYPPSDTHTDTPSHTHTHTHTHICWGGWGGFAPPLVFTSLPQLDEPSIIKKTMQKQAGCDRVLTLIAYIAG